MRRWYNDFKEVASVLLFAFFTDITFRRPTKTFDLASADLDQIHSFRRPHRFLHTKETELHTGWTACHAFAVMDPALGCTWKNQRHHHHHKHQHKNSSRPSLRLVMMNVTTLPTTAMAVLLDHQQINIANENHITMENIYHSRNLEKVPDIHSIGRDYYTLLYQIVIPGRDTMAALDYQKVFLKLAGINYRVTVWYNGIELSNLQYRFFDSFTPSSSSQLPHNIPGMFVRHLYDITPTHAPSDTNLLVLMIEPPFHPGYPVRGQQGGSHDLAKDGAVPQYMLGWDWCTSMPDRATGFYGSVTLLQYQSSSSTSTASKLTPLQLQSIPDTRPDIIYYLIHDPAIQTIDIYNCSWSHHDQTSQYRYICSGITLRTLVHIEWSDSPQDGVRETSIAETNITVFIESDWGEVWSISLFDYNELHGYVDVRENMTVHNTTNVQLWWPHGVGILNYAHRHDFTFHLYVNGVVTDTATISVGIRTIDTFLDQNIQGQRYQVNHHDVYLVGGNWIGTDQALRYSASKKRYCHELLLHQYAGFNLIRVWGGSTAERDQFYECADLYGILVYQEFWMTGDNNGRWAGNYSWPLDYNAYLVNVEDTIKRLRHHPSLLFYGGCNECLSPRSSPWAPNPPRFLDDGIRRLLEKFDPGRFYISSSMGGPNKGDSFYEPSMYQNRTFSLAYADGPYGMLLPSTYFDRNPGQSFHNISIGFQPEIGSVSIPSSNGLSKFLSETEIKNGYPRRNASIAVGVAWIFHNFLPWTSVLYTNESYDHVHAYFGPNHEILADDWNAAAQLAAHAQYQQLCNGYISGIFKFTSGFVIWKTQSPWPSMRGFLYDWYLETTGMLTGARSALASPLSVVLNLQSWQLILVNRQVLPISCERRETGVQYSWIDIHGTTVAFGTIPVLADIVPAMSAIVLGLDHQRLKRPNLCSTVCFLRIDGKRSFNDALPTSWYWLTDPNRGATSNYSQLGELRFAKLVSFDWDVVKCNVFDDMVSLNVLLQLHSTSENVLLYPTFSIFRVEDGSQLLPLLDRNQNDVVVLPGTSQKRILEVNVNHVPVEALTITLNSWNGPTEVRSFSCPL